MKTKYKNTFETIYLYNRWLAPHYSRSSDWTIIGIHTRFFSWDSYCYKLCFFGFEMSIWFKRQFISPLNNKAKNEADGGK